MAGTMRAWAVATPGPIDAAPLVEVERPIPEPGPGEVRLRVLACGVCRTDLHLCEGDLAPRRRGVVPGHEIVGVVDALGAGVSGVARGDRLGAAWLARTCGACRFCRAGRENLCVAPTFTGWDIDGGFAQYVVVLADYLYRLPEGYDDVEVAPLLCAGIIGYRALRRAALPEGGRLGIYGFGGSAHLTAQIALAEGATLHVMTRAPAARALALALGAASAGDTDDDPGEPLDAAILFAPVGDIVPIALSRLDRGGTLAIAGIYLSDIPPLDYERHLFEERTLRSVTANTRDDGREFLAACERVGVRTTVTAYDFGEADRAVADLKHERFTGAAVLVGFDG